MTSDLVAIDDTIAQPGDPNNLTFTASDAKAAKKAKMQAKIDAARQKKLDGKKKRLIKVALPTDRKTWYGFAFEEIKLNY